MTPQVGEFLKSGFKIIVTSAVPPTINLDQVFSNVRTSMPAHLMQGLDYVYIGDFSFLRDRDLTAMYKENALFISSAQDDEEDMVDDIIHEIGHLVEETYRRHVYADGKIEREFIEKRRRLYHMFEEDKEMFNTYFPNYSDFLNPEYDHIFDTFLYKNVGYDNLRFMTTSLFYSPYGATSLREYFANGFEAYYYHKDLARLKNLSPQLYTKIKQLEIINEE